MTTDARRYRRGPAGPLVVTLVVVAALTACGARTGSGSSTGASLPVLHIGTRDAAMPAAANMAGSAGNAGSAADDPYPLATTLPSGPTSATVFRAAGAVSRGAVDALAQALGVEDAPVRHPYGWEVSTSTADLRVRDDGTWSFTRPKDTCPPAQVDLDSVAGASGAVACSVSPSSPSSAGAPVSQAQARTAAEPVLRAAGIDPATATTSTYSTSEVSIVGDPVVEGHLVVDASTSVVVGHSGIRAADGVLLDVVAGPAYPVVPAADALEQLRTRPVPAMAIACVPDQPCPGSSPQKVVGVELGLSRVLDSGTDPLLVPTWLFRLAGSSEPASVIAVVDAYRADPGGPAVNGSGAAGSSPGAVPGSAGAGPASAPPSDAAPGQASPPVDLPIATASAGVPESHPVTIDRATVSADGRSLTLTGIGGMCETYRADAKADSAHVYAVLTGTWSQGSAQACPAMAQTVSASVRLDAALGSRTVLDAGRPALPRVPVTRAA